MLLLSAEVLGFQYRTAGFNLLTKWVTFNSNWLDWCLFRGINLKMIEFICKLHLWDPDFCIIFLLILIYSFPSISHSFHLL